MHNEHVVCWRTGAKTGSVGLTWGSGAGVGLDIYLTLTPSSLPTLVVGTGSSVKLPILGICFFDLSLFFVYFLFPSRKRLILSRIKMCS
jgi:ABC-type Fe3+-siderophore transport system permease subunit